MGLLSVILGHEGHHLAMLANEGTGSMEGWLNWIGSFHLLTLHFPIALIIMTAFAEVLFSLTKKPLYDSAAYFMLIMSAILTLPNAILGLLYSLSVKDTGEMATLLTFHMISGILTALLAIFTAYVRIRDGRTGFYLFLLAILLGLVSLTAYLGGAVTFGSRSF